jgi:hypothetical protein
LAESLSFILDFINPHLDKYNKTLLTELQDRYENLHSFHNKQTPNTDKADLTKAIEKVSEEQKPAGPSDESVKNKSATSDQPIKAKKSLFRRFGLKRSVRKPIVTKVNRDEVKAAKLAKKKAKIVAKTKAKQTKIIKKANKNIAKTKIIPAHKVKAKHVAKPVAKKVVAKTKPAAKPVKKVVAPAKKGKHK